MVVERFLEHIEYEKRYSRNTIIAYRKDLDQFRNYLQLQYSMENPADARHDMIRSWIVSLLESGITPRSINRKVTCLKSFYRFLIKEHVVEINPMGRITPPKTSQRLPVFVEEEKMELLLEDVKFPEGFIGQRDRLTLELFYGTGMRLSELTGLKDENTDLASASLKVTGKRNKERIIPLSERMARLIEGYMEEKKRTFPELSHQYLIVTDTGKPAYGRMIYRLVNHYLQVVTTIKKKSPHVLRHTFATHMLNKGADLNAIKEILGHSSLAATQVYTHNTIEKLKTIYKQAHPKA